MGRKKNILNKPAGSPECIWDAGPGLATKIILMCRGREPCLFEMLIQVKAHFEECRRTDPNDSELFGELMEGYKFQIISIS